MRLRPIGFGDGSNPTVFALADRRLLRGPPLEEGDDFSSLFGAYDAGSHPSIQGMGIWINSDDDPRREVVIVFGEAAQLTITLEDTDNAVLTKAGRGFAAAFGSSTTIGTCTVVDLP